MKHVFKGFVVNILLLVIFFSNVLTINASTQSIYKVANNAVYGCRRTFGGGYYDSVSNKTFICWSGPKMAVYVKEFDHSTSSWGNDIKIADLNQTDTNAYHDYPVMSMLPDGNPAVFYVSHSNSAYMIKAPNANSIEGSWIRTKISDDDTAYPMPVIVGDEVYFFYSQNTNVRWPYRVYRYIKSNDNGSTWSSPVTIIDSGQTSDKFNEVYAFGKHVSDNRICITWVMAGGSQGHNIQSKNLYYAEYDTISNNIYNADGTNLGTSITGTTELESCVAVNALPSSTGTYSALHPIQTSIPAISDDGTKIIAYGVTEGDNDSIKVAKFSSGNWVSTTAVPGTRTIKDMEKLGTKEYQIMYVPTDREYVNSIMSSDNGDTWIETGSYQVPFNNNADTVQSVNFIENKNGIDAIGTTLDSSDKKSNYTGVWPVFVIGVEDKGDITEEYNIALNKTVTYSSQQPGNEAYQIVDGDESTRWSAETFPQWVEIDLESMYSITKSELIPYNNRAYQYEIEVSTDGLNYTKIVDRNNNTEGGPLLTDTFSAIDARYVRLTVKGCYNDSTSWSSILELRIFGEVLNQAEKIVDENFNNMISGNSPDGWIVDTTGGTVVIAEVPSSTDKSIQLYDSSNISGVKAVKEFNPVTDQCTVEYQVMFNTNSDFMYNKLYNGDTEAVRIRTWKGNLEIQNGSKYEVLQSYNTNEWYTIKIVADISTNAADIYINDVKVESQVSFNNAVNSINSFQVNTHTTNYNMIMYVDNVVVTK